MDFDTIRACFQWVGAITIIGLGVISRNSNGDVGGYVVLGGLFGGGYMDSVALAYLTGRGWVGEDVDCLVRVATVR